MKGRYAVSTLAVAVGLGVSACGSTSETPSLTGTPVTQGALTTATMPAVASSTEAIWCALTIGESKEQVLAAMPPPNGAKAAAYIIGHGGIEWDSGNDIFLASFVNQKASNLQAFAGSVGPIGASDISCAPFRH